MIKSLLCKAASTGCLVGLSGLLLAAGAVQPASAQNYQVELVVGGLNKPIFATHMPGDPDALYVVQQRNGPEAPELHEGTILRLDLTDGSTTEFLTIGGLDTDTQGGLHCLAFHPDYQPGVEGSKFYIIMMKPGDPEPLLQENYLEEWVLDENGDPQYNRLILKLPALIVNDATHQMDWCGFRPGATGDEKDYLYVTQGDGGIQSTSNGFVNNPQDLSSLYGKLLRLDIGGGDDRPLDDDRNYGFTPTVYNGDNDATDDVDGVTAPEVMYSGMRNPWRASFDRANGDFYYGDIGNFSWEEVNHIPGGVIGFDINGDPAEAGDGVEHGIDFGWARREGFNTAPGPNSGGIDPDGAGPRPLSIDPIAEWSHGGPDSMFSITGGYVYRGPQQHPDIQGKYFFSGFMQGRSYVGSFDTNGDFQWTEVTQQYDASLDATPWDIDRIASYAEDAAGNLYLLDFGDGAGGFGNDETGWQGVLTAFGSGQIYKISLEVTLTPGDADGDGDVDNSDLQKAISNFTGPVGAAGGKTTADGDTDGDGDVDNSDLQAAIANFTGPQN